MPGSQNHTQLRAQSSVQLQRTQVRFIGGLDYHGNDDKIEFTPVQVTADICHR